MLTLAGMMSSDMAKKPSSRALAPILVSSVRYGLASHFTHKSVLTRSLALEERSDLRVAEVRVANGVGSEEQGAYTFSGTTYGLRYFRPKWLLASLSPGNVSVLGSKVRVRPRR